MRNKFINFIERILRISPLDRGKRIFQANDFMIEAGRSESNVAVSLSNLGGNTIFVTSLPDNDVGVTHVIFLKGMLRTF